VELRRILAAKRRKNAAQGASPGTKVGEMQAPKGRKKNFVTASNREMWGPAAGAAMMWRVARGGKKDQER